MAGVLEVIPVAGWMTALFTIATVGMFTHSHWIWMAEIAALRVVWHRFASPSQHAEAAPG
jgi:hypothetical protein